jgi:hypothetical protein
LRPGESVWPAGGLAVESLAACLSLASLLSLGRLFGVRPALRGLATTGAYRLVRHPMYFAYLNADVGVNLEEWNAGTVMLVSVGWASLVYRISRGGARAVAASRMAGLRRPDALPSRPRRVVEGGYRQRANAQPPPVPAGVR